MTDKLESIVCGAVCALFSDGWKAAVTRRQSPFSRLGESEEEQESESQGKELGLR